MQKAILSVLIVLSAIPLALLLKSLTKDEKPIYKKYFKFIIPILAILSIILYFINLQIALTLTFMFLLVLFWNLK